MDRLDPKIAPLIDAYIDQTIGDAQFVTLCDWLREDAAHRRAFARKLAMHSAITEWCTQRSSGLLADELQAEEQTAPAIPQPHTWIDELSDLDEPTDSADRSARSDKPLTPRELAGLTGYVLRQALTTRAAYRVFAAAAVVLIAATLFFVFNDSDDADTTPDFTSIPSEPGRDDPAHNNATNPIVATLTATHDALWDRKPHEHLRAGQRLTLTAGFAEITTARGAIAILEAPATVEFTHNNNALELHSGKLVGICETDSSKGFLVRTPHMDVTDLGTRFGVDATSSQATEVHVIEGLVEVAQNAVSGGSVSSQRVSADQAVVCTARGLSAFAFDSDRFVSDLPAATVPQAAPGEVAWFDHPLIERKESEHLQVYTERTGLMLADDLPIDIDGKGNRPSRDDSDGLTIPAGTAVDVYLLFLDTPGGEEHKGLYTVRFDRPILGVIGKGERLDQTDGLFAPDIPGTSGGSARGAIEDLNSPGLISDDGRTLRLTLRVAATYDQLRVLVAAE